jgi:hypothetical protein
MQGKVNKFEFFYNSSSKNIEQLRSKDKPV